MRIPLLDNGGTALHRLAMKIFLDGSFVDAADAKVSVFDHGLLYGDGVFEGIRLYQKNIFRLDAHLERLEYSAKAIALKMPWTRAQIAEWTCEACRQNGLTDGYIRLVVTRGVGNLGLSPKRCAKPSIFIIADKISLYPPELYTSGLDVITVPTRRMGFAALPPAVKSLNYLNNIMAKIEAENVGYQEAILLNDQGYVAECTGDNVFAFFRGELLTPKVASGALRGITRDAVIDLATELKVPVRELDLTRYDLWIADEMFLTGTAAEVIPVVKLDGREIGTGRPGPLTAKFIEAFRRRVTTEGTRL